MKQRFLIAFLLLCAPAARADITLGTPVSLSAAADCGGTCAVGNYTVPAVAPNQVLRIAVSARTTASHTGASTATVTVGGVAATPINGTNANVADKQRHFYILAADLPAPGAQAVSVGDSVQTDLRSAQVTLRMDSGVAQQAPEASAAAFCNSCTTFSLDLTGVSPGAVIFFSWLHQTDSGTDTPTPSIAITTDGRFHRSLEQIEVTGGSVAIDPSWVNTTSGNTGVSSSFAPAPANAVAARGGIIQPWPVTPSTYPGPGDRTNDRSSVQAF